MQGVLFRLPPGEGPRITAWPALSGLAKPFPANPWKQITSQKNSRSSWPSAPAAPFIGTPLQFDE
eukprot:4061999-Pyramimonas_sp.AAC.1